MLKPIRYPFDETGSNSDNLVVDEEHTLVTGRERRILVPNYVPFYTASMRVYDGDTGRELDQDDWYMGEYVETIQRKTGLEVASVVIVTSSKVSSHLKITYQTVGGAYSLATGEIIEKQLEALSLGLGEVEFDKIVKKPNYYPPAPHLHSASDVYDLKYLIFAIDRLAEVVMLSKVISDSKATSTTTGTSLASDEAFRQLREALETHTKDFNNPHRVTAAQVGAITQTELTSALDAAKSSLEVHIQELQKNQVDSTATKKSLETLTTDLSNLQSSLQSLNDKITSTTEPKLTSLGSKVEESISAVEGIKSSYGNKIASLIAYVQSLVKAIAYPVQVDELKTKESDYNLLFDEFKPKLDFVGHSGRVGNSIYKDPEDNGFYYSDNAIVPASQRNVLMSYNSDGRKNVGLTESDYLFRDDLTLVLYVDGEEGVDENVTRNLRLGDRGVTYKKPFKTIANAIKQGFRMSDKIMVCLKGHYRSTGSSEAEVQDYRLLMPDVELSDGSVTTGFQLHKNQTLGFSLYAFADTTETAENNQSGIVGCKEYVDKSHWRNGFYVTDKDDTGLDNKSLPKRKPILYLGGRSGVSRNEGMGESFHPAAVDFIKTSVKRGKLQGDLKPLFTNVATDRTYVAEVYTNGNDALQSYTHALSSTDSSSRPNIYFVNMEVQSDFFSFTRLLTPFNIKDSEFRDAESNHSGDIYTKFLNNPKSLQGLTFSDIQAFRELAFFKDNLPILTHVAEKSSKKTFKQLSSYVKLPWWYTPQAIFRDVNVTFIACNINTDIYNKKVEYMNYEDKERRLNYKERTHGSFRESWFDGSCDINFYGTNRVKGKLFRLNHINSSYNSSFYVFGGDFLRNPLEEANSKDHTLKAGIVIADVNDHDNDLARGTGLTATIIDFPREDWLSNNTVTRAYGVSGDYFGINGRISQGFYKSYLQSYLGDMMANYSHNNIYTTNPPSGVFSKGIFLLFDNLLVPKGAGRFVNLNTNIPYAGSATFKLPIGLTEQQLRASSNDLSDYTNRWDDYVAVRVMDESEATLDRLKMIRI